jgi:hypothetical protein
MRGKLRKAGVSVCLLASIVLLDGTVITYSNTEILDFESRYVAQAFDEARFKNELIRILRSEETVAGAIQGMNIPASHREVYRDHMEKLWGNDLVVNTFVDEVTAIIPALNLDNPASAREFGMAYSASWFQEKAMKGILRLDSEAIRINLRAAQGFFETIPASACRAAVLDEMTAPEMMKYEVSYLVTRPQPEVRGYLGTLRKSVISELSDYPSVKTVTPSQRQIVDRVLGQRLADALDAHPNGDAMWIGLDNINAMSDQALCDFTAITIRIAAEEKGEVGDWMVRYLLQ